jgi:hypothetical protein
MMGTGQNLSRAPTASLRDRLRRLLTEPARSLVLAPIGLGGGVGESKTRRSRTAVAYSNPAHRQQLRPTPSTAATLGQQSTSGAVPTVCNQKVRGSSPLSSTGQRSRESTRAATSAAAGYRRAPASSGHRPQLPTPGRAASLPRMAGAGTGHRLTPAAGLSRQRRPRGRDHQLGRLRLYPTGPALTRSAAQRRSRE